MKLTYKAIIDKFSFVTNDNKEFTPTDILFDDRNFEIEFFICQYGGFLNHQRVLVSPLLIDGIYLLKRHVYIDLDSKKVKSGPTTDFVVPVSEEYKGVYLKYPTHTIYPYYFGAGPDLLGLEPIELRERKETQMKSSIEEQNHNRAMSEVSTYAYFTKDEKRGSVSDWIIDTDQWKVTSFSAEVGNFWHKDHFLVSIDSVLKISFLEKEVLIDMILDELKGRSRFYPDMDININEEVTRYDYYGRARDSKSI